MPFLRSGPAPWLLCLLLTFLSFVIRSISAHNHDDVHKHHLALHNLVAREAEGANESALDGFDVFELARRGLHIRQSSGESGQTGGSSSSSSTGDYTCGPGKPCGNGGMGTHCEMCLYPEPGLTNIACCGKGGWCGYGDTYCGDGCQSNCDAKAECGENADPPGKGCPLNVWFCCALCHQP